MRPCWMGSQQRDPCLAQRQVATGCARAAYRHAFISLGRWHVTRPHYSNATMLTLHPCRRVRGLHVSGVRLTAD